MSLFRFVGVDVPQVVCADVALAFEDCIAHEHDGAFVGSEEDFTSGVAELADGE